MLIARGADRTTADRLWTGGLAAGGIVAMALIVGLSGGRIGAL